MAQVQFIQTTPQELQQQIKRGHKNPVTSEFKTFRTNPTKGIFDPIRRGENVQC